MEDVARLWCASLVALAIMVGFECLLPALFDKFFDYVADGQAEQDQQTNDIMQENAGEAEDDLGDEEISEIVPDIVPDIIRQRIGTEAEGDRQNRRIKDYDRVLALLHESEHQGRLRAMQAENLQTNIQDLSTQNKKLKSEVEHLQEQLNVAEMKAALSAKNENETSQSLSTSKAAMLKLRDQFELEEVRRKMMQQQHHNLLFHMEMRGLGVPGEPNRLSIGTSRSENSDDTVRGQNDDNESSNKYQRHVYVEIGLIRYLKKDIKSCEKLLESQSQSLEEMHQKNYDQARKIKGQSETIAAKDDLIQRLIVAAKNDQERLRMAIIEEENARIEAERALELDRNGWESVEVEAQIQN